MGVQDIYVKAMRQTGILQYKGGIYEHKRLQRRVNYADRPDGEIKKKDTRETESKQILLHKRIDV